MVRSAGMEHGEEIKTTRSDERLERAVSSESARGELKDVGHGRK